MEIEWLYYNLLYDFLLILPSTKRKLNLMVGTAWVPGAFKPIDSEILLDCTEHTDILFVFTSPLERALCLLPLFTVLLWIVMLQRTA